MVPKPAGGRFERWQGAASPRLQFGIPARTDIFERRIRTAIDPMSWSTEQTHQMVEHFWQSRAVRCPDDNGPLRLKLRKLSGGDYGLWAECLFCGKSKELRRADDPRRNQFRSWTLWEMERLIQLGLEKEDVSCPVCGTQIEKRPVAKGTGPLLIRCFRCGNSNQWRQVASLTMPGGTTLPGPDG